MLWQAGLPEHAIGRVSRQDLVIDREGHAALRRAPDVVIAFAMADEYAASTFSSRINSGVKLCPMTALRCRGGGDGKAPR